MAKDKDKPAAVQPNPALNPKPAPAAPPSHEVGAKTPPAAVPGGQIPAPGELPSVHGNTPTAIDPTATANPASGVFDEDDAKRQTTVGQGVETKTGERVEDGPDPDDAELRAYLTRRFGSPAALSMFMGFAGDVAPAHRPGDGLEPLTNRPPARAADAPVPLSVLAVGDAGDVSIRDVVGMIRRVMDSIRGGNYWEALGNVGELLKAARGIFDHGQHLVTSMDATSRRDAFREWQAFDAVANEWANVKADGFAAVATGNAPPAASGAAMPMGGPIGVALAPGDFAQIIGVVETIIDLIRRLRSKRGG